MFQSENNDENRVGDDGDDDATQYIYNRIWGPIFPNGEELLKEILTRIKSHQFHAICLTVWICKSNPFTILQQVPQVPQPTNTAKQVKNHLGRKSQGIQKRQPIKRFHMKKSFVAQNSPLFHWKNSRQIQIKACDNESK
uniref:Uncharacterized protein n=1 Tax=Rhizophagus irregularis (strain DAOM 181602 / DAOM 197198 / MUCL 43194) TaxID=747089 RepID=U9UIP4_RHIID